jgi:protein TonB
MGAGASIGARQSDDRVYAIGKGVTSPVLIKEVKPVYPQDAKDEGVKGVVELEGVVEKDGSIDHIRVTRNVDARLDEAAIKALSQWQFKPGTKDGEAVPVRVNVEITFTLR